MSAQVPPGSPSLPRRGSGGGPDTRRAVLAVALVTWRAALRTRAAAVLAVLLAIVVGWLPGVLRDDGTALGRAQVVWTYARGLAQALVCVGVVWLAADAPARELRGGPAQLLGVRPLARGAWWLGWWLGVSALVVTLSGLAGVLTAARVGVANLPRPHRAIALSAQPFTLASGESRTWTLPPGARGELRLRPRCVLLDGPVLELQVGAHPPRRLALRADACHTVALGRPAGGSLALRNRGAETVAFGPGDGPTLLTPGGGRFATWLAGETILALQLLLLAALGCAAGSALSFPVAALVGLGYLVAAAHAPLLVPLAGQAGAAARLGLALTAGLHRWWPVGALAEGRALGAPELGGALATLGPATLGLVLLGVLVWRARELGRGDQP